MHCKRTLITLFLGLFIVSLLGTAGAFERHEGLSEIHPVDAMRLLFNDDQDKKLDDLLNKSRPDMRPLYMQLRQYRQELETMFKSDSVGDQQIKTQISKISGVEYQLALKHAALTRAIRKIATPDQLAKVDQLEADQMKSREEFYEALYRERAK